MVLGAKGAKAAVLHDWLYASNAYPRKLCDYYFYLALRESGMGYTAARAMHLGVRVGGAKAYALYTEILEEQAELLKHTKKAPVEVKEITLNG